MNDIFNIAQANVLGLPNYPLDPAKLPISVEPGGLSALLEDYPGPFRHRYMGCESQNRTSFTPETCCFKGKSGLFNG
jgi:hypothetical protein